MSEANTEKRGLKQIFSDLIYGRSKTEEVQLNEPEVFTNNVISGTHNKITEIIFSLVDLVVNSRIQLIGGIQYDEYMDISSYLDIMSRANLIPYGESIITLMNSVSDFSFEFIDHIDDDGNIQKFCIIRNADTTNIDFNSIFAIFQVTSNKEEYNSLKDFIDLADGCICDGLEHFIYRHICGVILNYVKLNISRFPLPEENMVYIISEWPNKCKLVNFNSWISTKEDMQE